MVPLLNRFHLAASCLGNHDVDYGWPHLTKLIADLNFPCASPAPGTLANLANAAHALQGFCPT